MPNLDRAALDKLRQLGGDAFVAELIDTFLTDMPGRIRTAVQAGQRADWEGVERAAHSLSSSAGMLGASDLLELGRSIEQRAARGESAGLDQDLEQLVDLFRQYEQLLRAGP